ncbi:MAG: sigma-70 family RNA polymerase sigma factor [Lachnospiraceae bacterium]|nr:sigma-70 family RNA polymerase sigma factor [Lachnospiraceae bacterium]
MNRSEQELITLLQTHPDQAMEELIEQYTGLVWSIVSGHLNYVEDIRECVNDTFAEFYFQRERFDASKGSLSAYLSAIARNRAISKYQKNKKLKFKEPLKEEILADDSDPIDQIEWKVVLEKAMEILSADELQLMQMKYYENMTVKEIAEALHLPYETIKKRHQRSILKMRKSLLLLLIIIFVTLLTACAYYVLRYFGVVPGYGINLSEETNIYTLTETVSGENDRFHVIVDDAFLMDGELQLRLLFALKGSDTVNSFTLATDEIMLEYAGTNLTMSAQSSYVALSEAAVECTIVTTGLTMPEKETESLFLEFYCDDIPLSFTLSKAAEESIEQYYSQMAEDRGLLAIPRLENGELITGIYPLNQGDYEIIPALNTWVTEELVWDKAPVTVTDSAGNVLEGRRIGYSPVSYSPYYDWNFGSAQPGTYTLHVPYIYTGTNLPEDFFIPLDLENGVDTDTVYSIPGGTVQITDYRKVTADEIPTNETTTIFYDKDSDYWLVTLVASLEEENGYIIDINLSPKTESVRTGDSYPSCNVSVVALPEPNTVTLLLTFSSEQFDLSKTALIKDSSTSFRKWDIVVRRNQTFDISFILE